MDCAAVVHGPIICKVVHGLIKMHSMCRTALKGVERTAHYSAPR